MELGVRVCRKTGNAQLLYSVGRLLVLMPFMRNTYLPSVSLSVGDGLDGVGSIGHYLIQSERFAGRIQARGPNY
jgi:hypothetical protein